MTDKEQLAGTRGRGRPRAFDRQAALRLAMNEFWLKGFDGCSISDLTAAMKINSPSLYAAFGGKDGLYREAIDLYSSLEGEAARRSLDEPGGIRDVIRVMLKRAVKVYTAGPAPRGCMVLSGGVNVGLDHPDLRALIRERQTQLFGAVRRRLLESADEGELLPSADIEALTTLCASVLTGLAVLAREGCSRTRLLSAVDAFVSTLPVKE